MKDMFMINIILTFNFILKTCIMPGRQIRGHEVNLTDYVSDSQALN